MFLGIFLLSCSSSGENSPSSSPSSTPSSSTPSTSESSSSTIPSYPLTSKPAEGEVEIPLYVTNTDPITTETTYVTLTSLKAYIDPALGDERVYLSIDSYLSNYFLPKSHYSESGSSRSGPVDGVYRYSLKYIDYETFETRDKDYVEIDVNKNTITVSNLHSLCFRGKTDHPLNMAAIPGEESIHTQAQEPYSETYSPMVFDYGSYGFDEVIASGNIYLPPLVISTALSFGKPLAYNGYAFFDANDTESLLSKNAFTDFYWYGSRLHEEGSKSEAIARYDANSLLFTLDHVYGGKDIRPEIKSTKYGDYLRDSHPEIYEALYSTDPATAMNAFDWILLYDIGDGHTGPLQSGNYYNPAVHEIAVPPSRRTVEMQRIYNSCADIRSRVLGLSSPEKWSEKYLEMDGDTAILRFDQFVPALIPAKQSDDVYEANIEKDTYSLFYTAFRKIAEHGGIKNVVIDLSLNGGGAAMSLMDVIGFVGKAPTMETYEASSNSYFQAKYLTDCNADGVYEEGESPVSKYGYNMFVLTSGTTFSCANIFTYYAKKNGAKIIGKQSGGGAYSPSSTIMPDGYSCDISSGLEFGRTPDSGESIDEGIPVDINLEYEDFYSIEAIKKAIAQ